VPIDRSEVMITHACGHETTHMACFMKTEDDRSRAAASVCENCYRIAEGARSLAQSTWEGARFACEHDGIGLDYGINWIWLYFSSEDGCKAFIEWCERHGERHGGLIAPWREDQKNCGWKFATRVHK
jgi:hypothetical protein